MSEQPNIALNTEEQQRQLVQQMGSSLTQSQRKYKISLRSTGDPSVTVAFLAFEDIRTANAGGIFQGSDGFDVIRSGAGESVLAGGLGFDFILGGSGTDTVDYGYLDGASGVVVDLARRFAEADADGDGSPDDIDILSSIENVRGTTGDDVLRGDSRDNRFESRGGNDTIDGRGGIDTLRLDGRAEDYSFRVEGASLVITGPDGTLNVSNVELIEFGAPSDDGEVTEFVVGASAVARDDVAATGEDAAIAVDVAANDDFVGGGIVEVSGIGAGSATGPGALGAAPVAGSYGSLSIAPDGTLAYVPDDRANALDTGDVVFERFAYQVAGGDKAVLVITVRGSNDAPTVGDVALATTEEQAVSASVAATAADADDAVASLTYALEGDAPAGLVFNADGSFVYDPTAVFDYLDDTSPPQVVTFQYTSSDGEDRSAPASVSITVRGVNDRPVVSAMRLEGNEDAPISGRLAATDAEGQTLVYALRSVEADLDGDGTVDTVLDGAGDLAALGLSLDADTGEVVLDPRMIRQFQQLQVGHAAELTLHVTASDGRLSSEPVTVLIQVDGRNDAPIAASTGTGPNLLETSALLRSGDGDGYDGSWSSSGDGGDERMSLSRFSAPLEAGGSYVVSFDLVSRASYDQAMDVYWGGKRLARVDSGTDPGHYAFEVKASESGYGNRLELVARGDGGVAQFYAASSDDGAGDARGLGIAGLSLAEVALVHTDEDTPTLAALAAADIEGDSLSYSLVDVTVGDRMFTAAEAAAAGVRLDADGSLFFDPTAAAAGDLYQRLNVGDSVVISISYRASDGQDVSDVARLEFAVDGRNDAASVSGTADGLVTEDGTGDGDPATSSMATGNLFSEDVDNATDVFEARDDQISDHGFGRFSVTSDGRWSYVLDGSSSGVDRLAVGEVLIDTFTVRTEDGTPKVVQVVIQGANDAPVVSGVQASYAQSILNSGGQPLTVDLLAGNLDDPNDDAFDPDASDVVTYHSAELTVNLDLKAEAGEDIEAGETTNFNLDYEVLANAGLIQIDGAGRLQIDPLLSDVLKEVMAEGDTFNIHGTVRVQDDSGAANDTGSAEVDITIHGDGKLNLDDLDLVALAEADPDSALAALAVDSLSEEPAPEPAPLPDFTPPPETY